MPRRPHPPLLLVDGYNMIGAWPALVRLRDRHSLEDARRNLVELLLSFTAARDYHTEIVFDAQYQALQGTRDKLTSFLSVYYTDYDQTADTYIEGLCAELQPQIERLNRQVIVATSDRSHQQTVQGYGAYWMSAHRLHAEVEMAAARVKQQQRSRPASRGRFLVNSLDPTAQKRLAEMRLGLDTRPTPAPKPSGQVPTDSPPKKRSSKLAKSDHF